MLKGMIGIGDYSTQQPKGSHKEKFGTYFVIITCRNSELTIKNALLSHMNQTVKAEYIIVINDGSTDNTGKILEQMQNECDRLYTINHPDWGYDVRRIVRNWNEAIKFSADMNLPSTDYHLIATDDTIYATDYAEKIIRYMDSNLDVAIVSGNYAEYDTIVPRGAGRFVRNSFFNNTCWHGTYPEKMGYESAILYEAVRQGKSCAVLNEAKFEHLRRLGKDHKFYEFGASMRTLGYHPAFVFGRFLRYFVTGRITGRVGALYMLYNYLAYRPKSKGYDSLYPSELRKYVRGKQSERIKEQFNTKILRQNKSDDKRRYQENTDYHIDAQ